MHPKSARPSLPLLLATAVGLVAAGCHRPSPRPVSQPEPFTAQLTEVDGVQAIVSLRHPQLVNQDVEKLMTAVPSAMMLRMAFGQLRPYGYPGFSDIAAGSNVGVAIVSLAPADLKDMGGAAVGFAKITVGGKLWRLLQRRHLAVARHGDWVLFARDAAVLAKLPHPDGVIAYLGKPQAEDLRIWVRVSPEFLAAVKDRLLPGIKAKFAGLPAEKKKAALEYFDVLYAMTAELHSVDVTLAFRDDGIALREAAQFLPGTPFGNALSYRPGPPPAVAAHVSADALGTIVFRHDPQAAIDLTSSVIDPLVAVDYPPMAARLGQVKASYLGFLAASDGGGAGAFNLTLQARHGRVLPKPETFYVVSGGFSRELVRTYLRETQDLTAHLMPYMLPKFGSGAGTLAFASRERYTEDALSVGGIPFDSEEVSTTMNGKEIASTTEYVGVANGWMVWAQSSATLRQRLPALLAKTPVADGIPVPDGPGEIGRVLLNGGKLVDLVAAQFKLDLTDPDNQAQVAGLKDGYAAAGPILLVLTAGQAKGTVALTIPYKFLAASMQLGLAARSWRVSLAPAAPGAF